MLKTALLLALASVKRVGDLQALSISPACLEFGLMTPRLSWNQGRVMCPKCFPLHSELRSSCSPRFLPLMRTESYPCSALSEPWEFTLSIPPPLGGRNNSFFSFGNHTRWHPVMKQRLSRWIVDAVTLVYSSLGLQCPIGLRAHSTRGIISLWAWSNGVSITEICAAAGWASPSTFVRFYNLDVPALQARVLSA